MSQSVSSYALDWAVSEKAAAKFMNEHYYDIIISDVFLSGSQIGLNIWKNVNPETCTYIFASSIKKSNFEKFVTDEDRAYLFLEKPLDTDLCIQLINEVTLQGPRFKYA